MRVSQQVSNKDRKRLEMTNFRGVDTASAKTAVATKRSVDMRNMENRDGTNHKRYGWVSDVEKSIFVENFPESIVGKNINLTFEASINNKKFIFIHIGNHLRVYSEYLNISNNGTTIHYIDLEGVENKKSYAFYSNGYVYFIGLGKMYAFGSFDNGETYEFKDLRNDVDFTYIPKVISQISPTSAVSDEQVNVDDFNLLTNYIRLGLTGVSNESSAIEYKLPRELDLAKDFKGEITYKKNGVISTKQITIDRTNQSLTVGETRQSSIGIYNGEEANKFIRFNNTQYVDSVWLSIGRMKEQTIVQYETPEAPVPSGTILEFSNGYKVAWNGRNLNLYKNDTIIRRIGYYTKSNAIREYKVLYCNWYYPFVVDTSTTIETTGEDWTANEIYITDINNHGAETSNIVYGKFPKMVSNPSLKIDNEVIGTISNTKMTIYQYATTASSSHTTYNIESPTMSDNIEIMGYDANYEPNVNLESMYIAELFGANGSSDRIFAVGVRNKDNIILDNLIYWTEYSDNENFQNGNAFTYWADTAYASIGATQADVVAMKRLNDSSLALFKEKINNEANFVILNASYIFTEAIGESNISETLLKVTSSAIDLPQNAINNDCFGNTVGSDILFLSKNGVYSLKISTGVAVERYCQERSEPIANLFKAVDFQNTKTPKAIVYKNKYYLYVYSKETNEDLVLVADARYKYTIDRNMDDTFNYEWYIWEHCPVNKWVIEEDKLGFYDFDGVLNFFEEDNYTDSRKVASSIAITRTDLVYNDAFIKENSMGFSYAIAQQNIGKKFKIEKGLCYQIRLSSNSIIYKYPDLTDTISSILTKFDITNPTEEDRAFAQSIYDFIRQTFIIKYNSESNAYLLYTIRDKEEVLVDGSIWSIYTNNSFYKFYEEQLDFVKAYWITPCLDLGATDFLKTLFTATIGIDDANYGGVYVGIKTRYDQRTKGFVAGGQFNMADLGFGEISLGKDFANAYTTKMKIRDFAYIQFYFGSNTGKDLAVNNITILYKYNTKNKGVH